MYIYTYIQIYILGRVVCDALRLLVIIRGWLTRGVGGREGVCIHTHTQTHIYIYIDMYTHTRMYIYIHIYLSIYLSISISISISIYTHPHTHTHTSGHPEEDTAGGGRGGSHGLTFGLHTPLSLSIVYGVWHTQGGSGGGRILRNGRAIVLQ